MEALLRCYSNIPVCLVYWVLTLFFLPNMEIEMGHFNHKKPTSLFDFLFLGLLTPKCHQLFTWRGPTVLWLEEGETDHFPCCLFPKRSLLYRKPTVYQESGKQRTNVNLVFVNQKCYALIFKYTLKCTFLHLILGVQRKRS